MKFFALFLAIALLASTVLASSGRRLEDCDRCTEDRECKSRSCIDGKCGDERTRARCPKAMCAKCRRDSECKGMNCYDGICTNETYKSLIRCGRKRQCKGCEMDTECATKKCFDGRCVFMESDARGKCRDRRP